MLVEYQYKALNNKGDLVEGKRTAESEIDLSRDLRKEELNLVSADPASKFSFKKLLKKLETFGTVPMHDKIIVYRNTSSMLAAGLSLARALSVISRQAKNKKLKAVLDDIQKDIKKGSSFSSALEKFPSVFTPLMVSMVKAGEESGNLTDALNVTAEQMEKTYKLKKKIKGAMIYPGVIITAMIGIAFFMLLYIVPTLTATFNDIGVELPATTRFIVAMSDFLQANFIFTLLILVVLIVGFILGLKTKPGVRYFSWVMLHIPVISTLVKKINSARTARTLSSLLSSGVSFVKSLEIVKEVVQNPYYKEIIDDASKNIKVGKPISEVFIKAEKLYPIFVGEMMAVGEETGELGPMLMKVADFYEDEVDEETKNLSTIIEPILMIVVGAAVGFFAISMISPMYTLVENI